MSRTRCQWRRTGFTLVETLLGLTLSALVGIAVMVMFMAVNTATEARFDVREAMVNTQAVALRIGASLRGNAMVLGTSADWVVLWKGDANLDGVPSLSELRAIEYDAAAKEIRVYQAPAGLPPGSDTTYPLSTDFVALAEALTGTATFQGHAIVNNVSNWNVLLDASDPHAAHTARAQITVEAPAGSLFMNIISSLRCSSE